MSNKRILVIDDEPGIRQIIQISLNAIASWEVFLAASGAEGIKLAENEQPDAILLDVMMPDMDGMATLNGLQNNPSTRSIPVILLTAKERATPPILENPSSLVGMISKPFKPSDLVAKMRLLLIWPEDDG